MDLSKFHAAIFDLDGTLIRSEPAWEAAKIEVLAQYEITPSQALLDAYVGRGIEDFVDEVFGHTLSPEKRTNVGNQIAASADVLLLKLRRPIAGAIELLCALHDDGVRIAICSSSPRRQIMSALAELGITNRIETIVSASELPKGKPDPLPYLTSLAVLDLEPHVTCAFEDSLPGARSAFDAGMVVFAVGQGCTSPEFEFCHIKAECFADLSNEGINA